MKMHKLSTIEDAGMSMSDCRRSVCWWVSDLLPAGSRSSDNKTIFLLLATSNLSFICWPCSSFAGWCFRCWVVLNLGCFSVWESFESWVKPSFSLLLSVFSLGCLSVAESSITPQAWFPAEEIQRWYNNTVDWIHTFLLNKLSPFGVEGGKLRFITGWTFNLIWDSLKSFFCQKWCASLFVRIIQAEPYQSSGNIFGQQGILANICRTLFYVWMICKRFGTFCDDDLCGVSLILMQFFLAKLNVVPISPHLNLENIQWRISDQLN